MQGMYNTNALQTFVGAVEGVRADQRANDDARMRMRALDSQLATEKAERDLLPARLALDSKKLEYEMSVGKLDMLMKTASTVDVLATSSLDRTVKTEQHQEWRDISPLRKGMMNLEYQNAVMDAWFKPLDMAHKLRQYAQQDTYGPLYAMAAFLTSIAPNLVQAYNVIEKGNKEVEGRVSLVTARLADAKSADAAGKAQEFHDAYAGVIDWSNGATGRSGKRSPDDAVSGLAYAISGEFGERFKVTKDGRTQYSPPTDETASSTAIQGARDNLYAKHIIKAGRSIPDGHANDSVQESQKQYNDMSIAVTDEINALALEAKDPKLAAEIQGKIDLLLFNTDPGAQAQLREYLVKKGGEGLVVKVFGNQSLGGLQNIGYTLAGHAELKDGLPSFTKESAGPPEEGSAFINSEARRIWPDEMIISDDFNNILRAKSTRDGTMTLLGQTEDMLGLGAQSAGDVFRRAISNDLLKGNLDLGTEGGTVERNAWSMVKELGQETLEQLDTFGASVGYINNEVEDAGWGKNFKIDPVPVR